MIPLKSDKKFNKALASGLSAGLVNQRVAGMILNQGTSLGCGAGPQ